jgi:fluoride exporter
MYNLGLVALGGALGAGGRHLCNMAALRMFGSGLPVSTIAVNVVGSFLMGVLAGWFAFKASGGGEGLRLFLATGILGGFTTFSAFSLDAVVLWERGAVGAAFLYVLGSVILSILGLVAGLALVRVVT